MVYYFESTVVSPAYVIFMGLDKHENEDLIKWGFPEDVWFHVDKMSSAHVYLRLPQGQTLDDIPSSVLVDCAQIVKANSIQGNKTNNISVVYTPWANLHKSSDMEVGQVGFHNHKEVLTIKVEKRINEIVNRLNKTKVEKFPNLREEREERDRSEREEDKKKKREQKQKEKEEEKRRKDEASLRSYDSLMQASSMKSNREELTDEEDFM